MNQNEVIDSSVLARGRADRLRRLRNLANLSRKELCDGANININTYIGYEVVRYGGLTKKGAEKVVRYVATKGVYTTIEWLMYDVGPSPQVITDDRQIEVSDDVYQYSFDHTQESQKIAKELYIFHQHYKPAIDYRIADDGMSPRYDIGDYVAGILYTGSSIDDLIGMDCIVKTAEGELLVRSLCHGKIKDHYTLTCNNPKTSVIFPVMHNVKIISAAYIIWHRRICLERKRDNEKITTARDHVD